MYDHCFFLSPRFWPFSRSSEAKSLSFLWCRKPDIFPVFKNTIRFWQFSRFCTLKFRFYFHLPGHFPGSKNDKKKTLCMISHTHTHTHIGLSRHRLRLRVPKEGSKSSRKIYSFFFRQHKETEKRAILWWNEK